MIEYKSLAPNELGHEQNSQDFRKGIWRVYFYDSKFPNEVKEAYANRMDLKIKAKIDVKNIETVRNYLEKWTVKYLQNKKFEDIRNKIDIFE